MHLARTLGCTLALATLSTAAHALDFEITPFVGYRFGGQFEDPVTTDSADLEPGASFGLAFDVTYAPGQAIQVFYSRQSSEVTDIDPSIDVDVEYLQIGGVGTFPSAYEFEPYLLGSIGAASFSPSGGGDDETVFALSLGGGLKYYFNDRFGLRFEGRGYVSFFDTDGDLFCVSGPTGATCRLRAKGSAVWQIEAQAGFTFRF
jgi:hypothetical protein